MLMHCFSVHATTAILETRASLSHGLRRWAILSAAVVLALAVGPGCSSQKNPDPGGSADPRFQKVSIADQIYVVQDFLVIGFRESKRYNVSELPKAVDAWYGFWKPGGIAPKEFELRFYGSHEDAVEAGTVPAEDASGEEANLDRATALWKEGHRDRRAIYDYRAAPMAKYKDYAIFGNVVLLCEGKVPAESLEHCEAMINALGDGTRR